MKKLIIASALLSIIALPVLAQSSDNWDYGEYGPEKRESHAQDDEILSNCVNTNKNLYCADEYEGGGVMEINDNQLYQNCNQLGCVQVENERFIRSESGRLIQVNPTN
jgi:hypothetical protein